MIEIPPRELTDAPFEISYRPQDVQAMWHQGGMTYIAFRGFGDIVKTPDRERQVFNNFTATKPQ